MQPKGKKELLISAEIIAPCLCFQVVLNNYARGQKKPKHTLKVLSLKTVVNSSIVMTGLVAGKLYPK